MVRFIISAILVLSVATIDAQDSITHQIKIVAHRGGVIWGPENTIATFLIAADKGVDYLEMDVRQTKDGEFVLMHDKDVNRTTNGKGKVEDMTLAEIKALDAGSWFSDDFKGEKVPTLREVLRAIDGKLLPDLDFKAGDPEALVKLLEEEGFLDGRGVTMYSGSFEKLKQVRELTDKIWIRPGTKGDYEYMAQYLEPQLVNISWSYFTPTLVQEIQKDGRKAFVNCLFRADKKKNMKKAIEAKVDFIQADKLDVLIPLLQAYNQKQKEPQK